MTRPCTLTPVEVADDVRSLPLGESSEVNQQFWESLYSQLCNLAPMQLDMSQPAMLSRRLLASPGDMLHSLFALDGFESSVQVGVNFKFKYLSDV